MARSLTSGMINEVSASELKPLFLVKAEFDSGDVTFWTGYGPLEWNGDTYTGSGQLLSIDQIRETQELVAQGVDLTLSGIPQELIAIALAEQYQGRPLSIWFACMDSNNTIIADPYMFFRGFMDIFAVC